MKWISVKDKLPEPYFLVLAFCEEGYFIGHINRNENFPTWRCVICGTSAQDSFVYKVTHWTDLPESPFID